MELKSSNIYMNKIQIDKEELLCRYFLNKRYQERVFTELSTKRRDKAIGRLCHNVSEILCEKLIVESFTDAEPEQIINRIRKY